MRAPRLLSLVPTLALALGVGAGVDAAEHPFWLVNRVVPTYGVRHDLPFRVPSRIESEVAQVRAYLAALNTRLLTWGAGSAELANILRWQQDLATLVEGLVPAISVLESQQLDAVIADLDRASESIAMLTETVVK